jgi:hypothetical protein
MTRIETVKETSVYDEVPPKSEPSPSDPNIPTYSFAPGRQRAVSAANISAEDVPIVDIRCAARLGQRQRRRRLGDVRTTDLGDVLVVIARQGDTSVAKRHKGSLRPDPDDPGHLSDREFEAEHPILLDDVRAASVWCRTHGEWALDVGEVRRRTRHGKKSGRRQTLATAPPTK